MDNLNLITYYHDDSVLINRFNDMKIIYFIGNDYDNR